MSAIFEVSGLQKNFGGLVVTNNVSLSLSPGDRTVLIGPNGAGKTTFVNLVTGNIKPSAGTVRIAGEDVTGLSASQRVKRGLVRSFQVTRLFQDMTPEEHVALAILQREGRTGRIFGRYRAMPAVMGEARDILGTLGLTALAETKVREIAWPAAADRDCACHGASPENPLARRAGRRRAFHGNRAHRTGA